MSYILRSPHLLASKVIDRISSSFSLDRQLISINNNILYLDIPKTGSSFIKSSLVASGHVHYSAGYVYPHSAIFKRPRHLINDLSSFEIYAFVRDPILRFCSVYREKILANSLNKGSWSPSRFYFPFCDSSSSPSKFIRRLIELPLYNVDKHLLPQYLFIKKFLGRPNFTMLPVSSISDFISSHVPVNSSRSKAFELKTDPSVFGPSDLSQVDLERLRVYYASDVACYQMVSPDL